MKTALQIKNRIEKVHIMRDQHIKLLTYTTKYDSMYKERIMLFDKEIDTLNWVLGNKVVLSS